MKHFALIYRSVPDIMERRGPYRAEHLDRLRALADQGKVMLGGAFVGAPAGTLIIFQGEDDQDARAFAASDPYVRAGLIEHWEVREWTTVVGAGASTPVK